MTRTSAFRRALLSTALLVVVHGAQAQTTAKPPPRLPPNASQTSQIPNGVDTGSPGGSDSLQLGTPVMSNSTGSRSALKGGSAAARAAARPKPTSSSVACTKAIVPNPDESKVFPAPLPKPGVVGKATSPPANAKAPVAPGATRIDC